MQYVITGIKTLNGNQCICITCCVMTNQESGDKKDKTLLLIRKNDFLPDFFPDNFPQLLITMNRVRPVCFGIFARMYTLVRPVY